MDLETVDKLLTTTRSVRKRLDLERPVEPALIEDCVRISLQAPTGSNQQGWRVVVVTDADKRAAIADIYRRGFDAYMAMNEASPVTYPSGDLRGEQQPRVLDSSTHLTRHLHQVPVMVLYCIKGRLEDMPPVVQASSFGSVLPAAWSFMLAARARGLGSAWTTIHLFEEKVVAELLGIPDNFTQAVLLPVAYFTGEDFKPAKRIDAGEFTYWDSWGRTR